MRNLKLIIAERVCTFDTPSVSHVSQPLHKDDYYVADGEQLCYVKDGTKQSLTHWCDYTDGDVKVTSCDVVGGIVCTTLSTGHVMRYDIYEEENMDVVGRVIKRSNGTTDAIASGVFSWCLTEEALCPGDEETGIEAASWCPDEELLILVTSSGRILILNSNFFVVNEFELYDKQFGKGQFVNLGWGKKETQFHGAEGKQNRTVNKVAGGLGERDDYKPKLSWRGDGQLFVLSFVEQDGEDVEPRRRLKVFNREGELQYTSEVVDKLEHQLAWKPSGSLIASSQRLPNGNYNVVFFEKNGLRHGEFTLQNVNANNYIMDLKWNCDSTILAVWLKSTDSSDQDLLQLYTTSNYVWYLKEEMKVLNLKQLLWEMSDAFSLILLKTTCISTLKWCSYVNKTTGRGEKDLALVSVINGTNLLQSPFKNCNFPPPICAYKVSFPEQIKDVLYPSFEATDEVSCNDAFVFHGNKFTLLASTESLEDLDQFGCQVDFRCGRSPNFKVKFPVHKIVKQFDIGRYLMESHNEFSRLYNLVWLSKTVITALVYDPISLSQNLIFIDVSEAECKVKQIDTNIQNFINCVGYRNTLYLQNSNGEIFVTDGSDHGVSKMTSFHGGLIQFPSVCPFMECITLDCQVKVLGLSSRNRLFLNYLELSSNCSSFIIHRDHLLVTTTSHLLYSVPLKLSIVDSFARKESSEIGERNLERGSQLITMVADECSVILQMPRGNLETIFPRHLMIHFLSYLIDNKKYHKAVELMRKHRIDMDLLYDHNPKSFLNDAVNIIQTVDNPTWIDLLLAGLKNSDTTKTLYASNYSEKSIEPVETEMSKVDFICSTLRKAMIEVDEDKFLLPILTSLVKMDNRQIDTALKIVKDIKDANKPDVKISAKEGLRHLLYIANADVLCDVALGTYDFALVMMVFEESQKDPKEYMPFLNNFKNMEGQYMRYSINIYLKRYRKAFESIKNTGSTHLGECMKIIKKEKLFSVALEEFIKGSELYLAVAQSYAEYNIEKGYYGEAALLFERAGNLESALNAYQRTGNWRKMLVTAYRLKYERNKLIDLYYQAIEDLKERKSYAEAAVIYKDYLNSEEDTVECLSLAHKWDDAMRVAYQFNRIDLIETNIIPELLRQHSSTSQEIVNISESFTKYCERLKVVRKNLNQEHQDILDGKDVLDSDMYCDTSSTVTGASLANRSKSGRSGTGTSVSGRTYRSSKNRRKLERKKYSTKEGSSFEDLGIIAEIHGLILRADVLAESVNGIVSSLYGLEKEDLATELQRSLYDLLRLIEKKEKEVWPPEQDAEDEENQFGAHMSTAQLIQAKQGNVTPSSLMASRMKELEPHMRFMPKPNRPANWSLGFLQKKDL